ncbi:Protein of unknown function, partial [Cotesia congregata]
ETSEDVLECLSVMVNNEESQVQGILVNEHPLLGATLTAITLPDGSQAFVANDPEDLELKNPLDKATRTILIGEFSDLSNTLEQPDAGSSNQPEIPGVEIIDDATTTYMLTSHSENQLWELSGEKCGKSPNKDKIFVKKISQSAQKPFECKLCFKRYRQNSTLVMHKRTAHALVEDGDEELNGDGDENEGEIETEEIEGIEGIFESNCDNLSNDQTEENAKDCELLIEGRNSGDNATQILFVGDSTQIAVLQHINFEEDFNEAEMDSTLEGLNIKIEDMEFGWN